GLLLPRGAVGCGDRWGRPRLWRSAGEGCRAGCLAGGTGHPNASAAGEICAGVDERRLGDDREGSAGLEAGGFNPLRRFAPPPPEGEDRVASACVPDSATSRRPPMATRPTWQGYL